MVAMALLSQRIISRGMRVQPLPTVHHTTIGVPSICQLCRQYPYNLFRDSCNSACKSHVSLQPE